MPRISKEQMDDYNTGGIYLSLKDDKDTVQCKILAESVDDIPIYAVHQVKIDGVDREVSCLREKGDPLEVCPLCAAKDKVKIKIYIPLLTEDGVKVWVRGKTFYGKLDGIARRNQPFYAWNFEIERNGKAGDQGTTYEIYPIEDDQSIGKFQDVLDSLNDEEYEQYQNFLSKVVNEWTPEQMDYYLSTGRDPNAEEPQPRRGSRSVNNQKNTSNASPSRRGSSSSSNRASRNTEKNVNGTYVQGEGIASDVSYTKGGQVSGNITDSSYDSEEAPERNIRPAGIKNVKRNVQNPQEIDELDDVEEEY